MNFVKSFYNSLTNSYRPNIEFVKICHLKINSNLLSLAIILVIEKKINIYLLQLNPLNFNLISCIKTYLGNLLSIEPVNHISLYDKDFPVISIISNSERYNENTLSFYSVINQKELKMIKKKYKITSVSFGTLYLGIGCNHGKIYIHNNTNLDLIFKITQDAIIKISDRQKMEPATSLIMSDKNNKGQKGDEEELNEYKENNNGFDKKQKGFYNVLFDINNNIIVYEITKDKKVKKEDDLSQNKQQESVFESLIKGTNKNISKFAEWSFTSFQNMNQLRKSYTLSSNESAKKSTSSKLILSIFNFNSSPIYNKYISNQLLLPYFNEKIGYIKLTDLYLIVGNRENQMFYIFQYYAATNIKYSLNEENEGSKYKLIYSIWRGYQGGPLSSFDISKDKRYCILTSKKGTNHVYFIPKRENQIIELINFPGYSNKEDTGYKKLNEILNMKVINLDEINKINHNNYNDAENSLFYSKIIEIDQLYLENNFSDEAKEKIKELNKNRFTNLINNGRYFIILNDNYVYLYMIFDNNSIIKIKKIQLKLIEDSGLLEQNKGNINKNIYYNCNKHINEKNIEESFDNESTNLSFFSTTHLNPLFSFHTLKKGYENDIDNDNIAFYENICNDLEYTELNKDSKRKLSDNENNPKINIQEKIKEAMSRDIINIK